MMKFDADSIIQRIAYNLNEDPNWKPMLNNSVMTSLIRHNSEADAEAMRYAEYLFNESRWDTARNRSSIVSMANMLGYQPKRKVSAHGKLYVSLDSKISYVGSTITTESLQALKNPTLSATSSLNNSWIKPQSPVRITPACTVKDSRGLSYVVLSPVTLEASEPFTSVDVMQGVRKTKFINIDTIRRVATISKLNKYLYIPFILKDCEAATTIASRGLLNVYVQIGEGSDVQLDSYRVVDSLLLSSDGDQDVELYNDLYNQDLFYLKFKNDPYHGGYLDLSSNSSISGIRIDYVESRGSDSNMEGLYNTFYIDNASTSTNGLVRLYGINYSAMEGGSDEETISQIKSNAAKEYIKYYGIATKENYQRVILNTEFPIDIKASDGTTDSFIITPKKVQVYGGYEEQGNMRNPVTNISFIGTNLEDRITGQNKQDICDSINKSLNYGLSRLKSPQDTIRFVPPIYTSFALGLECEIRNQSGVESQSLSNQIFNFVNDRWSPNSNSLDFGRDFYRSEEESSILNNFAGKIKNISMEVEAVRKLDWMEAERINPWGTSDTSSSASVSKQTAHTCRIPFDFSTVFKGNLTSKEGFKDYDTGAEYVMRVDFLYKTPKTMGGDIGMNRSLFIDSDKNKSRKRTQRKFYVLSEGTGSEALWPDPDVLISSANYDELGSADHIETSYMVDFKKKVYDDNSYSLLKNDINKGKIALRNASSRGTIENYLIYFSGNYDTEKGGDENVGAGWIEISFDEIYNVLREYALYDPTVQAKLSKCPLSILKCDTTNVDAFNEFRDLISNYLEIYICMRPNDSNLKLQSALLSKESGFNGSNEILYIDTYDSEVTEGGNTTAVTTNLTSEKQARFISVNCSYSD